MSINAERKLQIPILQHRYLAEGDRVYKSNLNGLTLSLGIKDDHVLRAIVWCRGYH